MTLAAGSSRRWILAAAAAGLVMRLGFGITYWVGKPLTHDEREYLALAKSVSEGRGFVYAPSHQAGTAQQFGRAPGYPVFLAVAGAGAGDHESTPLRVKVAQSFLGAGAVWLIGLIALHAAGARTGVVAAAVAAVYPPLVWIPSYVFSESLYSIVALSAAHVLQRAAERDAGGRSAGRAPLLAILAGLLAGAGILVRPAMLFFLPLAAVWLLATHRGVLALAFTLAAMAAVAPWSIRNVRVHDRFVLVASEGGVTFWTGNHPLARGEGDLAANPALKLAELEFRQQHPGLTAEELEPLYYRDAFRAIAADPARWLVLLARKAFYTVVPIGPSYTLHSRRYWAASVVSYLALLAAAPAGFRRLWRSPRRPDAVLLLGASSVLVGLVFFPQERFRIPVIDPVLVMAAAAALTRGARA
jgi:4-amino-4-deoxy-L-arabinose transferase-like glycosyltransferase